MKERKKNTKSFIARSIEEIEKEAFEKGCEAAKREMIEKATQWLFENVYDYLNPEDQERVDAFRKYLEE